MQKMVTFYIQCYVVIAAAIPLLTSASADRSPITTYIYTTDPNVNQTAINFYLDRCLRGKNHKDYPSPEENLHDQCQPWSQRACCDASTTMQFHNKPTWYNFDWNHCSKGLSTNCRRWMIQDLCFYECSPNVGPWLVPQKKKIRDEIYRGVPLCRSECDLWFNACKDDLTCLDDWSKGWNWTTGTNLCPKDSTCRTFENHFQTAERFCKDLWGGSFNVVDDSESCMYLWFNESSNPNEKVALARVLELTNSAHLLVQGPWISLVVFFLMAFLR